MARITPRVEDGSLYLACEEPPFVSIIPLDSEQWRAWLEQHRTFRVKSEAVTYTARKERRAGQWYWYAYRRSAGKLRIAYLGKSEELTAEQLEKAAQIFALPAPRSSQARQLSGSRSATPLQGELSSLEKHTEAPRPVQPQVHGSLPAQLTSFVGRTREMEEAAQLLAHSRLLTLTGTGGIGKTRLALQIASSLSEHFPGGLCFITLAGITSPSVLLPALALALGIQPRREQDLLTAVQMTLGSEPTLLILDNCEHLLDACAPLVEQLLSACPALRVLATSREMLCISGETILLVAPLSLPGQRECLTPLQASQTEAVQLFLERIRSVQPSFLLTERNLPAVLRVCQRLEGIPLALELAAARLSLLPVEQLARRLDQEFGARFHLLTSGKRTAEARHQTLRATIDWSYQLLSPTEQRLLRQLAIFTGGWTLEAAESVCAENAGLTAIEILDLLGKLVHKSLVLVDDEVLPSDDDGQPLKRARYHLLETIREYSREKLQAAGEEQELQRQHLAYFLRLARLADTYLRKPQQLYWLACLDAEHDNLQAALRTARQLDPDAALCLASALAIYWIMRSQFLEGRKELEEVLALAKERSDVLKADCLYRTGLLIFFQGDMLRCRQLAEASLELFQALKDQGGQGRALSLLAEAARQSNAYPQALAWSEECRALLNRGGDDWTLAFTCFSLATIYMHQDKGALALAEMEESLRLMQRQGDRRGMAIAWNGVGKLQGHLGNYAEAVASFEESVRLAREIGDTNIAAAGEHTLAFAHIHKQDYVRAQEQLTEVRKKYERNGNMNGLAEVLFDQGMVAIYQRDFTLASQYIERSNALNAEQGNQFRVILGRYHLGRMAVMQRDLPRALSLLRESFTIFYQHKQQLFVASCLEALAALSVFVRMPRQGARWLGLAQSLHAPAAKRRMMVPAHKVFYDETVAALQTSLGEEIFAAEFAKGESLSLEQVVQEIEEISLPSESSSYPASPERKSISSSSFELTVREIEVLHLLATGLSNKQIASSLSISPGTVRAHLSTIYSKLAVHSRTAAVHTARTHHLI